MLLVSKPFCFSILASALQSAVLGLFSPSTAPADCVIRASSYSCTMKNGAIPDSNWVRIRVSKKSIYNSVWLWVSCGCWFHVLQPSPKFLSMFSKRFPKVPPMFTETPPDSPGLLRCPLTSSCSSLQPPPSPGPLAAPDIWPALPRSPRTH